MGQVTVAVDDDHLEAIADVADALRSRGMQVSQVLDTVGIITGSVPDGQERSLQTVDGVVGVEQASRFQLPPPDEPVQ